MNEVRLVSGHQNEDILMVYSPRQMERQVVKPIVMNFNKSHKDEVDDIVNSKLNINRVAKLSSNLKASILPDYYGNSLDTNLLGSRYTFMYVRNNEAMASPIGIQGTSAKHVLSGYFTECPFSDAYIAGMDVPVETAINPNAYMIVTDSTLRKTSGIRLDRNGLSDSISSTANHDGLYGKNILDVYQGQNMLLSTPSLSTNSTLETVDTQGSYSVDITPAPGCRLDCNVSSRAINNKLKSPTYQLNNIVDALVNTDAFSESGQSYQTYGAAPADTVHHHDHISSHAGDVGSFLEEGTAPVSFGDHIDAGRPSRLSDLFQTRGQIDVHYVQLNQTSQFDVCDQGVPSTKAQLSSLATHVFSSTCVELGILEMRLLYSPYSFETGMLSEIPRWEVDHVVFIEEGLNQSQCDARIRVFLNTLETTLFDIIKTVAGMFDIVLSSSMGGDCLVDLELLDFQQERGLGYTTTPLVYGAIVSPLIGTHNQITNNALQLAKLIDINPF